VTPLNDPTIQAVIKTAPAIAPGAVTIVADWLGVISTTMSIILVTLSIAFLVWRWRVAWQKEKQPCL